MAWIAYSAIFAITLFLLVSFMFFKKVEPAFAENI